MQHGGSETMCDMVNITVEYVWFSGYNLRTNWLKPDSNYYGPILHTPLMIILS